MLENQETNLQTETEATQEKKPCNLKVPGIIVGSIVLAMITINIIPPAPVVENNPFVVEKGALPMIAAHRGGSINDPENTLKAYRNSVANYDIDIIESDLWLTKDNKLIYNHDSRINRTTDVELRTGEKKRSPCQ